jgi:hypothetical protein
VSPLELLIQRLLPFRVRALRHPPNHKLARLLGWGKRGEEGQGKDYK